MEDLVINNFTPRTLVDKVLVDSPFKVYIKNLKWDLYYLDILTSNI